MPLPTGRYLEREAAILWGYKVREWQSETTPNRAEAMAHFLHRTIREAFLEEKLSAKPPKGQREQQTLGGLMAQMGIRTQS